jgi:FkbM family methyltransferase
MEPLLTVGIDRVYDKIEGFIQPGDVVVDIGAHQGVYAHKFLQQTGPDGFVYCLELNPSNISHLQTRYGQTENVRIIQGAVCDLDGEVEWYRGNDSWTHNIIGHDTSYKPGRSLGKIRALRMDTQFPDLLIDFMKVDVEGAEIKVLRGCEGIIGNIKQILLECHLKKDWPELSNLVFREFGFKGMNLLSGETVTEASERPSQLMLSVKRKK